MNQYDPLFKQQALLEERPFKEQAAVEARTKVPGALLRSVHRDYSKNSMTVEFYKAHSHTQRQATMSQELSSPTH